MLYGVSVSSKHILGIGQQESGKVAIIHGNSLQCDHGMPIMQDCPQCVLDVVGEAEGVQEAEVRA